MRISLPGPWSWPLLTIMVLSVFLNGCSGDSSPKTREQTLASPPTFEGHFLDNAVEGLFYTTQKRSGYTRSGGTFIYGDGEKVTFVLGDPLQDQPGITLGTTSAVQVVTPVDLVDGAVDETHPAVTNMARLLLTLDLDGDWDNGIAITLAMLQAATGLSIDWSLPFEPTDEFAADPAVQHLLHEFNHTGYLVGTEVEGLSYESLSYSGTTDQDGAYRYESGEAITFRFGDIELGTPTAKRFITPFDLIPAATGDNDTSVTNMTRLLLTLDLDCSTANGITITEETSQVARGRMIDWSVPVADFELDADVRSLLDALATPLGACPDGPRQLVSTAEAQDFLGEALLGNFPEDQRLLVSAADAQAHLRATLNEIAGIGGGGDEDGTEDCRYLVPEVDVTVSLDPADENQMTVVLTDHSTPQSCVASPTAGLATIFWGDGAADEDVPIVVGETAVLHTYQNDGSYSIVYIFHDTADRRGNVTQRITVENLNDSGGGGGGDGGGGGVGGGGEIDCRYLIPEVAISVTQNDMLVTIQDQSQPRSCEASFLIGTANIFWGDGTKDEDVPIQVGVTEISHNYVVPGGYTIGYTFYDTFGKKAYVTERVEVP